MKDLTQTAKIYILTIILTGLGLLIWFAAQLEWQWVWLLPLAVLASLAQVLKVEGSTYVSSYNISWLVYGFAILIVGIPGAVFVILVSHLVEWVWYRYPWYIQCFNIANFIIAVSLAGLLYQAIPIDGDFNLILQAAVIFASLAVFTLVNHFLIGMVIKLARGQSFRDSGVFSWMTLLIDYALLGTGAGAALIWQINPFAAPLLILPLYLIYNTLKVPALQRKTEIDPKTGLFNAKYFTETFEKELARANLYNRPLTLILGDLDLLRNINNTYGHLAGDVVLNGIANIMKEHTQEKGIVARFGGEEYAILLPEMTIEEVYPFMEGLRSAVEEADFEVSTSVTPIKATISFGATQRENDIQTVNELIHNADIAMYRSKAQGRNKSNIFSNGIYQDLFDGTQAAPPELTDAALKARIDNAQNRYRPDPIREDPVVRKTNTETTQTSHPLPANEPKPAWMINAYITTVAVAALGIFFGVYFLWQYPTDWLSLFCLVLIVILTEAFAIEIYVKDTTISTSAIIILAGALLFGPYGAVLLSFALALTAKIKHRSSLDRFIFNTSNHLLYSSLIAGLVILYGSPITEMPILIQLGFSILAGVLAYLVNTALVSIAVGFSSGQSIRAVWVGQFRWLLPYYISYGVVASAMILGYTYVNLIGIVVTLVPIYMLRFSQSQYINHTKENVAQLRTKNIELEKQSIEIYTLNKELLHALADIVDKRDTYTYGHSEQVTVFAVRIAQILKLSQSQIKLIEQASLLHDIGKLGIPEQILYKPDKLSKDEYKEMKNHPVLGAEIIGNIHSLQGLVPIIRYHHERYDGKGYPEGLKGQEIPFEARIIALSDAFEAMASDRPYRKGLSPEEIKVEINRNSGTQFDPMVVEAFNQLIQVEGDAFIQNSRNTTTHMKFDKGMDFVALSRNQGEQTASI